MAIKKTTENLLTEIDAAVTTRDAHLEHFQKMVQGYHGPFFNNRAATENYHAENHAYEYITLLLPEIAFQNPRVQVKTRRMGSQKDTAVAIRHGLNRWVRDTDFISVLQPVAVDVLFNYGVMMTTLEDNETVHIPGDQATPKWPQVVRIAQDRYLKDPGAQTPREERWRGHQWDRDREGLIAEAEAHPERGWDVEAIKGLGATADEKDLGHTMDKREVPFRDQVMATEMWFPNDEMPDGKGPKQGFHGMIHTVAVGTAQGGKKRNIGTIREPRPFYGPRTGPYCEIGVYPVPGSNFKLSPLTATANQVEDLNRVVQFANESAAHYKRIILVGGDNPKVAQVIKDGKHDHVFAIPGIDKSKIIQVEIAGMSQHTAEYIGWLRDRVERVSGMSEAERGKVPSSGTATASQIAANSGEKRKSMIRQAVHKGASQVLASVAWYLYYDDKVKFPLGEEAAAETGNIEPWFEGGDHDNDSGATFDDLSLEIEAGSMERADETSRQASVLRFAQFVAETAGLVAQTPYVPWDLVYQDVARSQGIANGEDYVDMELAGMIAGLRVEAEVTSQAQPLLGKDAGAAGVQAPKAPASGPAAPNASTQRTAMPGIQAGASNAGQDAGRSQKRTGV